MATGEAICLHMKLRRCKIAFRGRPFLQHAGCAKGAALMPGRGDARLRSLPRSKQQRGCENNGGSCCSGGSASGLKGTPSTCVLAVTRRAREPSGRSWADKLR